MKNFIICIFFLGCVVISYSQEGVYTDLKLAVENKSKVKQLILSGQKLKKIPKEVFELYNLELLDVSRNKIETFPVELIKLKKLEEIDLSNNKIEALPEEIREMKRMRKMDLTRNKIWKLPKELGELQKLETLILSKNPIFRLPEEMKNCTSLQYVDLRFTDIVEGERNHIVEMLPGVTIIFDSGCNCGPNN